MLAAAARTAAANGRAGIASVRRGPGRTIAAPWLRSIQCRGLAASASEAASKLSYAQAMFLGEVNAKQAFPYPDLLDDDARETIQMLTDPVKRYMESEVDSAALDREGKMPEAVLDGLKEMGLFGLQIPQELGGLGLTNSAYARVAEEISVDASVAVTLLAHQSIGLKGILLAGTQAQKEKYLPRLASGEHVASFALTEPLAGSDAGSVRTRGTLSADGKHWLLNGSKIWITNGEWSEIFTVFAQTEVDGKDKVTAFIVERSFGGLTNGKPEDKLGIRASSTTEIFFDNCPVPVENVLGEVGGGFKVAMDILNNGRFGLGAGAGSMMKRILTSVSEHVTTRKQFGRTLSEFGLIKEKVANIAVEAYVCESMAYLTTQMIDRGDPQPFMEAAICKIYGSDCSFSAINETIQMMGGAGFMKHYPYERNMRDARILSIFEGTNEILRMLVALSGIRAVGDRLKGLQKAASNPLSDPGMLMGELASRIRKRVVSQTPLGDVLAMAPGGGDSVLGSEVAADLKDCARVLERGVGDFGSAVETLVVAHGKGVIEQQQMLRRVADICIDLYALTATVSRASRSVKRAEAGADHEVKLVKAFAARAGPRIQVNLAGLTSDSKRASADDALLADIASDVIKAGSYIPKHPLGV